MLQNMVWWRFLNRFVKQCLFGFLRAYNKLLFDKVRKIKTPLPILSYLLVAFFKIVGLNSL